MKKLIFLFVAATLFIPVSSAQELTKGHIGAHVKPDAGRQYIEISKTIMGWPAETFGLKAGYRIYAIDGVPVKEMADPVARLSGAPGTYVKLSGKRMGADSLFDISVPRIATVPDDNNLSEGHLAYMLYTEELVKNMNNASIAVYHDEESDLLQYKSFDFDYTDATDPLQEKEIFRLLEQRLLQKGLVRDKNNPDILILMKTFAGQKEQYIPPEQIISTRVQTVYNWRWGLVPMPITESQTRQGYTEVTYLYSISLKFLDAKRIADSKLPPVIWSASWSETSRKKTALADKAGWYFDWLLWQFPVSWMHNADCYFGIQYAWTGIIYDRKDLNRITDVIPGSPAWQAGLRKGDKVFEVMDEKNKGNLEDRKDGRWLNVLAKWGNLRAFRYLYIFSNIDEWPWGSGEIFVPYKKGIPEELEFKVELSGKRTTLKIKPEKKGYFNFFTIK